METTGTLYVVATPIGNLEDITLRAIRILKEVDVILCEDTRVTGKLCAHYEISTPRIRYDAHASDAVHTGIISRLVSGESCALVSDAGTPGISDPGVQLITAAREVGCEVVAVPGPSAVSALVSIAGVAGNAFTFLGFVPQKKGRQTFFTSLDEYEHPVVFFESTHRIIKTLNALLETLPLAQLYVGRELTKMHEEVLTGTAAEILERIESEPVKQKGEFVIMVVPS